MARTEGRNGPVPPGLTLTLALALAWGALAAAPDRGDLRPHAIRAHVRFLADDSLEGRGTGTRGYDLAAAYVAAQFEAAGLRPLGADGGYLQPVPLRRATLVEASSKAAIIGRGRRRELKLGEDVMLSPDFQRTRTELAAPVVFAGYGIAAPGLEHDDYAGLDVRGKAVAVLAGAPPRFPADARAHYRSAQEKARAAAGHGAVAVLGLPTPQSEKDLPWERRVAALRAPGLRWVGPGGKGQGAVTRLLPIAALSRAGAEALFAGSGRSLDGVFEAAKEGRPPVFPLATTIEIAAASRHEAVRSANVVGLLPGSDPALAPEHVVFSAHLDHLGRGEPVDGDAIYNGAMDNALGVGILLEAARALAAGAAPRRSLIFLAVTAEEAGLLGSDYFVHHLPMSGSLVANINLEGIGLLFPIAEVVGVGGNLSTLGETLREAARESGLAVGFEAEASAGLFARSDQYSFARRGVPGLMVIAGTRSTRPTLDGAGRQREWMARRYHRPGDDMAQAIDYGAAARLGMVAVRLGARVAAAGERPRWKAGNVFADAARR